MKPRQILLDEESDRILEQLAQFHSGDRSEAIREALKMHKTMEACLTSLKSCTRMSSNAKRNAPRGSSVRVVLLLSRK